MQARILCDFPFPGPPAEGRPHHGHHHHGNTTSSAPPSAVPTHPAGDVPPRFEGGFPPPAASGMPPPPHHSHPQWLNCEIVPQGHGPDFRGPIGPTSFGFFLGILLCAIPIFILMRKVKRMKKMLKRAGAMHPMHFHGHHHPPPPHAGDLKHNGQFFGPPPHHPAEMEHLLNSDGPAPGF